MEVIRSRGNEFIQLIRKLADDPVKRRLLGQCVLLGERLIQDWLIQGAHLQRILLPKQWLKKPGSEEVVMAWQMHLQSRTPVHTPCAWFLLEGSLSEGLPGLGVDGAPIGLAPFNETQSLEGLPADVDLIFFDGIQDPGNLGTVMRTAAAFGVHACVPGPGCADFWSTKTLRAAMGAHQRLRLFSPQSFDDLAAAVTGPIRAADARGEPADTSDLRRPGLWVLGAEGRGLSASVRTHPRVGLYAIPMQSQTESFNAAIAQGILLYEQFRQRRE
jgi:TrmH family RNA methyltransferase